MRIVMASDHAGYELKSRLLKRLEGTTHRVRDLGARDTQPSDYPDFAKRVAVELVEGRAERGVLICGSGVGASVAANKIKGVRAVVAHDTYTAHQSVEHDDVNVLCLGSRVVGSAVAEELAVTFLSAAFSGEERHVRRLNKVKALEAGS